MALSKYEENLRKGTNLDSTKLSFLQKEEVERVHRFFSSTHDYTPTPLVKLEHLAENLGVQSILVKDESKRFGLNAFKVLGGLYAIARYICQKAEIPFEEATFEKLSSPEVKAAMGDITFASATDGNHGRGVAWAAQQLGFKAMIYMPKGSSLHRLKHITDTGAYGEITEWNYDDTVRYVVEQAEQHGWVIVQDTEWEGYKEIPQWIMQGYSLIAYELQEQLQGEKPTHVFLQAGVGSFAAAIAGSLAITYSEKRPHIIIVEPDVADCYYHSFQINSGEPAFVGGEMQTIMAGLACGEPNATAWDILSSTAEGAFSCEDEVAAIGMRVLGNPVEGDERIISGESGAAPLGLVYQLLTHPSYQTFAEKLQLTQDAVILCISTEGDTDPENYRKIVWGTEFTTQVQKEEVYESQS